jgi:hypothetical protein
MHSSGKELTRLGAARSCLNSTWNLCYVVKNNFAPPPDNQWYTYSRVAIFFFTYLIYQSGGKSSKSKLPHGHKIYQIAVLYYK